MTSSEYRDINEYFGIDEKIPSLTSDLSLFVLEKLEVCEIGSDFGSFGSILELEPPKRRERSPDCK